MHAKQHWIHIEVTEVRKREKHSGSQIKTKEKKIQNILKSERMFMSLLIQS